ncbi:MAG: long-chain fatty acid--CoA ligase [Candidatus Omnitrophica bacterium]|nr:long-chain fatty acid--CoA ligase [Candidatus Omnitrophota bacterium]MCM8799828.1 long-chain fatty acid--CoA ligase [Candidatus Omnitrophota bacterium]
MKELNFRNLAELLEVNSHNFKDNYALLFYNRKITYKEFHWMVLRLSQGLKNLGITKNDRVAIFLGNCPEFVISYFAILYLGAIAVPINNMLKQEELSFILKHSEAKLIISSIKYIDIIDRIIAEGDCFLKYTILIDAILPTVLNFYEIIEHTLPLDKREEILPEDVASILYTSGTTGDPKGVLLTHKNFLSNVNSCIKAIYPNQKDNFICILPMFHSFALTVCIFIPLAVGATITVVDHIRPFRKVIRNVIKKKVTIFVAIPSIYNVLTHIYIPEAFMARVLKLIGSVRICISGAAALPVEVLEAFEKKFNVPLLEGYGLTEASPVVSLNPLKGIRKSASVGLPLEGIEVKVVDDEGKELPRENIGELLIKGPNVMKGYFKDESATKETIKDGWLYSGDLAKLDKDGYIYIVDRKKDMINVRGLNVYPQEIEKVLIRHPKIKECAVIGVKDKFKGEVPKAFLVLKENVSLTEREVIEYLRQHIAQFKIPKYIEIVNDLPKTSTGKIAKKLLK